MWYELNVARVCASLCVFFACEGARRGRGGEGRMIAVYMYI